MPHGQSAALPGPELGCCASWRLERWQPGRLEGWRGGYRAPQTRPRVLEQAARLTSHRFRCPLTLQVVVTFTPAATPESKAAPDDSQTDAEKVKAERQKDRQNARGAAVNLDDIAAWPKSDC